MNGGELGQAACLTCYGGGETASERGIADCPDCGGTGALPPHDVLVEWRMRAIENSCLPGDSEVARNTAWLAFELRRSRHALVQILALSQESAESDAIAQRIRHLANDALGVYEPQDPQLSSEPDTLRS